MVFWPEVREFPPSPYCWFCANPAIWTLLLSKKLCAAPHVGHRQSSGSFSNWNPGGSGYEGSPTASSYLYPHDRHSKMPVFRTANFSSSRRESKFSATGSGAGVGVGVGAVSSFETSMELTVSFRGLEKDLAKREGREWGLGLDLREKVEKWREKGGGGVTQAIVSWKVEPAVSDGWFFCGGEDENNHSICPSSWIRYAFFSIFFNYLLIFLFFLPIILLSLGFFSSL